jgi:hypothetical protein
MKKAARALMACGLALAVLTLAPPSAAQYDPGPVKALVPTDFGDVTDIVATMEAQGWNVTAASFLDLEEDDALAQYDVVWISAQTDSAVLHSLVDTVLDLFAKKGGVVVVTSVNGTSLDIAPGGTDASVLPPGGAGAVAIVAADHTIVTGAGIGGVTLTASDFDPTGSGGRGSLHNAPEGSVVIAQNSDGPVLLEHAHGDGHVLVSTLLDPEVTCSQNLVLYVESLVP